MNQNNSLMIPGDGSIRAVDPRTFPDLDNAKVGIAIDPKYKQFKDGESLRCIFCGFTLIKKDELTAAVLQAKDGFYLNSGTSLVEQLKNLAPGTAVQVTYQGEKSLGGGKRVNLFQVNILDVGPVATQTVVIPSPSGASPTPAAEPKHDRPLDPFKLQELIRAKAIHLQKKNVLASQADRGIVATTLKTTFEGDDEKRHALQAFLIGKAELKKMSQPEVKALQQWLECPNFDSVPPLYVIEEAKAAYLKAVENNSVVEGTVNE